MKLKRILAVLLVVCMMLPLVACKDGGDSKVTTTAPDDTATTTTVAQGVVSDTDDVVSGSDEVTTATDEQGEVVTVPGETEQTEQGDVDVTPGQSTQAQQGGNKTTQAQQQGGNKTTQAQQQGGNKTTQAQQQGGNNSTTTQAQQQGGATSRTKKTKFTVTTATVNKDTPATLGAINVPEGDTPLEKGLNFGGKTYSFAYYGTGMGSEDHFKWRDDFMKVYNVKLDVKGLPTGEYAASLASAMAAGTPYDIVFLYSFDYPQQITANTMAPLNKYITTADLWKEGSEKTGGFSYSLMEGTSLSGNIYCAAGTYLLAPTCVWYNKRLFENAGYDDSNDPYALYKKGKLTWEALYEMLKDIQDPDKGLYGINTLAPYYDHQFINSFGTDFAKINSNGSMTQNLNDPQLYKAYQMLQKFCYGEQKVVNPKDQFENGHDQFFNGTTAALVSTAGFYWSAYRNMVEQGKHYSAFGSKAEQLDNLGCVPLPTDSPSKVNSVWDWMGYGAGNGATEEGILCALAFAKHDSIYNHKDAYHPEMPSWMKAMTTGTLEKDNLIAPMDGFKSSAGSLGGLGTSISSAIAMNGQNITVVLKGYEKQAQVIIDTVLNQ